MSERVTEEQCVRWLYKIHTITPFPDDVLNFIEHRLRASPVARTEGEDESDGLLAELIEFAEYNSTPMSDTGKAAFKLRERLKLRRAHRPPRVEPAATEADRVICDHGYDFESLRTEAVICTPACHFEAEAQPSSRLSASPPSVERLTEDEREALKYVIAENDGWIESGEKALLDPDYGSALSNYDEFISNERAEIALRKKHAVTLKALATRLSAPGAVEGDGK